MYGVYEEFNGTPEIMGVFDSVANAKADISYDVTVAEGIENGTVAVSTESGIYGQEITLTLTPEEGYRVDTVTLNGKAVSPSSEGTYKFAVVPGPNVVSATFVSATVAITDVTLTADVLQLTGTSYMDNQNVNVSVGGGTSFAVSYDQLRLDSGAIQMNNRDDADSALWNTSVVPYVIDSIEFHVNSKTTTTKTDLINVKFGTELVEKAYSASSSNGYVAFDLNDAVDGVVTVDCSVSEATYFCITHANTSGAFYFDSIVINFIAA